MRAFTLQHSRSKATLAALAFAVCGIHQNALADASTSASASNFRYVLSDLNPNDNIAPSLAWLPSPDFGQAVIYGTYWSELVFSARPDGDALLAKSWQQDGDAVSASIEGATHMSTTALTAASTSQGNPYGAYWTEGRSDSKIGKFLLSPGTSISIQLDYALSGSIEDSIAEYSKATANANLYGFFFDADGYIAGDTYRHGSAVNLETNGTVRNGTLEITLSNTTNDYIAGGSYFFVDTYALSVVPPPIPEPSTYAMLLGGLAVLGGLRKRIGKSRSLAGRRG